MDDFFNDESTKRLIEIYEGKLSALTLEGEFEKRRNEYMINILNSMRNGALEWDKFTYYNIKRIGNDFRNELKPEPTNEMIDLVFSSLFRFFMELYFYKKEKIGFNLAGISDFAVKNKHKFSETTQDQIDFTLTLMPFFLLRECYQGDDIQYFIRASEAERNLKTRMDSWDGKIEMQINKVEVLKSKLEQQENAYNFVALYDGFNDLSKNKEKELKRAFWFTLVIGVLVLLPFGIDVSLVYKGIIKLDSMLSLFSLVPAFTLTFIFIYYFRISLTNYTSIKAQTNQIELRKTLCRFIQKYSEYAKEMKANDGNSLEKFESIIFSNIMPSEDKIPSTFDGIEQIAKLIESVKGK
ncbi:hypothetical protein [Pectobacterium aroidearum]|uniref:hypothetical protein n=1 Tax=Pectobacterium aroidearum TaxID=1201031 RepID=UPI00263820FC|nr:hypothetical protein [Pectobacterium aroidearum]WKA61077.1 hypothetical protein QX495_13770 [Pectobacterium aroidearum]